MSNANPSINPADEDTLTGSILFAFKKLMQQYNNCLPGKVIAFSRNPNRAQIQILIPMINTNGEVISRPQVASVPVEQFGGGGIALLFNLVPGDLGWIEATDRDISTFLQSYTEQPPQTFRMHDFSSSKFRPNIMKGFTIAEEDATNCVLQTLDGTIKISIGEDGIVIKAPTDKGIKLDSKVTITDDLIIEGDLHLEGDAQIDGNTQINGTLGVDEKITGGAGLMITGDERVIGNITATGDITPHVP